MSVRTPNLQARSQYHSYWGAYAYTVGAGAWANGSNALPGAPGNPLSAAEFAKIETGDIASTTDASSTNRGLFVCVATPTAATVEWRRLDNAATSVVQTIRDAHVIVVAQQGGGYAPTTGVPATDTLLNLNPQVATVAADFIDPGDGTGLSAAITAATALSAATPSDIRLRPCNINLASGAVVTPLAIPARTRLIGADKEESEISGRFAVAEDQRIFTCAVGSSVERISFESPAPTGAPTASGGGIVDVIGAGVSVIDCMFDMGVDLTNPRSTLACVDSTSGAFGTRLSVLGCRLLTSGGSHRITHGTDSVAIRTQGASSGADESGPVISRCPMSGFDTGIAITTTATGRGDIAVDQVSMTTMYRCGISLIGTASAGSSYRFSDLRCQFEVGGVPAVNVQTLLEITTSASGGLINSVSVSGSSVRFETTTTIAARNFARIIGDVASSGAIGIKFVACGIEDVPTVTAAATDAIVLAPGGAGDANIRGGDILCDWANVSGVAVSVGGGAPTWEHAHQV